MLQCIAGRDGGIARGRGVLFRDSVSFDSEASTELPRTEAFVVETDIQPGNDRSMYFIIRL